MKCLLLREYLLQKAVLSQTDRATRYVSVNLVNCRKKLYNESIDNKSH